MSEKVVWYGFDPVNELEGVESFCNDFWKPLLYSFPDLTRQTHIFMGGKSNGRIDGYGRLFPSRCQVVWSWWNWGMFEF